MEAKRAGLLRYFTNAPCLHGHLVERFVRNTRCVSCHAAVSRNWYKNNQKSSRRVKRNWYFSNKKRVGEVNQKWRKNNVERLREIGRIGTRNYRARKDGAKGRFTETDIKILFSNQLGQCLCGFKFGKFHIDHKTPLSRGGSNWPRNLQLLCVSCNTSKGAKTMREWKVAA